MSETAVVPIEDVQEGEFITPRGWSGCYEVLAVEDTDVPGIVKVLWFVGHHRRQAHPFPPGPFTYFERIETVKRRL